VKVFYWRTKPEHLSTCAYSGLMRYPEQRREVTAVRCRWSQGASAMTFYQPPRSTVMSTVKELLYRAVIDTIVRRKKRHNRARII